MTTRQSYVGKVDYANTNPLTATIALNLTLLPDERQINQSPPYYLPDNPEEIWKPVVGFEGFYEVSSLGEIKSLPRTKGRYTKARILRTVIINTGYERVKFWKAPRRHSMLVHRVVAIAFITNPENLPEVNHIDGNPLNNKLSNLEWVTSSGNKTHAVMAGLLVHHKFKSSKIAPSVASDYYGVPTSDRPTWLQLAKKYGISRTTVARILKANCAERNPITSLAPPSHE